MGAGASASGRDDFTGETDSSRRRNKIIFQQQSITTSPDFTLSLDEILKKTSGSTTGDRPAMDPETESTIKECLKGFFFTDDAANKMELFLKAMGREIIGPGDVVIKEGEPGKKLYVIESGQLEVNIQGQFIRVLQRGAMFGELALLYDAPRSATVTCTEPAVLWSLQRDLFKYIQAMSASAQVLQRTTWMRNATELNALNPIDLSRLISTMQTHLFDIGDFLYKEGKSTKRCILIEQGTASIYAPVGMEFENAAAVDKAFNIVRPSAGKQTSTARMTGEQLSAFMRNPDSLGEIPPEKPADEITEPLFLETSSAPFKKVCEVYEGCILGLGALRGQNKSAPDSVWRWIADGDGLSNPLSPYTVQANAPMECYVFTTDIFERLFGSIESVLRGDRTYKTSFALSEKAATKKEEVLSHDLFNILGVRGSGSFGTVVIASRTESSESSKPMCALKLLFKTVVVKTGQLRHVLDERNLLAMMSNPFIVAYYGSYQTPDELVIVTEVLDGPDLWTIIYETPPYNRRRGLPFEIAQFYAASILFGLAHIHEMGIVYRDLKPENIMTDVQGYIRIIDFGFAKTVPFVKTDPVTGESKVHARTYTLCGTPEYLAPEFIFNLGHNQSADLWAYGVLVHEMVMGVTPFTPSNQNDVTQLFTNIALVQKKGLTLSNRIDQIDGGNVSKALISNLLKANPAERIGVREGSTKAILDHPFYANADLPGIYQKTFPAGIKPAPLNVRDLQPLTPGKKFDGDQKMFEDF